MIVGKTRALFKNVPYSSVYNVCLHIFLPLSMFRKKTAQPLPLQKSNSNSWHVLESRATAFLRSLTLRPVAQILVILCFRKCCQLKDISESCCNETILNGLIIKGFDNKELNVIRYVKHVMPGTYQTLQNIISYYYYHYCY